MKGKEEDEERNENICPQRTDRQTENSSKTEAIYPLWIVGVTGPITEETLL